ncbi:primosomal protein N', partial [Candidatus Magnetoovum chiemensis]
MLLYEILFPLYLNPLVYSISDELKENIKPGMRVTAPFKNNTKKGIVMNRCDRSNINDIRQISLIHGTVPLLNSDHLKLINWISKYYHVNQGLVLKNVLPDDLIEYYETEDKIKSKPHNKSSTFTAQPILYDDIKPALDALNERKYETCLIQTPNYSFQISYALEIIKKTDKALILFPQIEDAESFSQYFDDEIILIHGGLTKAKRRSLYKRIIKSDYKFIIGIRSAALCPYQSVSAIIVIEENSPYYKNEQNPLYNAKDVAVKRGAVENIPVFLLAQSPSVVSYYNTRIGKYKFIKLHSELTPPKVHIINIRRNTQIIPDSLMRNIEAELSNNNNILFYVNKKGYSLIICTDCGSIDTCPKCGVSLIYYEDKTLLCNKCGFKKKIYDFCPNCSSTSLTVFGCYIQRYEECIAKLLKIEPLRIDSDFAKTKKNRQIELTKAHNSKLIVATRLILKNTAFADYFKIIAVTNADIYFSQPDYLSLERMYHEFMSFS